MNLMNLFLSQIGASFHLTHVTVHVVDLKNVQPFGRPLLDVPSPFTPNQSIRKSFSRAEKPLGLRNKSAIDVKTTIEESTSGTDPEEESSAADITNVKDYNEIFRGRSCKFYIFHSFPSQQFPTLKIRRILIVTNSKMLLGS